MFDSTREDPSPRLHDMFSIYKASPMPIARKQSSGGAVVASTKGINFQPGFPVC